MLDLKAGFRREQPHFPTWAIALLGNIGCHMTRCFSEAKMKFGLDPTLFL